MPGTVRLLPVVSVVASNAVMSTPMTLVSPIMSGHFFAALMYVLRRLSDAKGLMYIILDGVLM